MFSSQRLHCVKDQAFFIPRGIIRSDALDIRPVQLLPARNATLAHSQPIAMCGFIGADAFDHAPLGLISLRQGTPLSADQRRFQPSFAKTGMPDSRATASAVLLLPTPGRPVKTMSCMHTHAVSFFAILTLVIS